MVQACHDLISVTCSRIILKLCPVGGEDSGLAINVGPLHYVLKDREPQKQGFIVAVRATRDIGEVIRDRIRIL